jgi:hypothetical protein
VAAAAEEPVRPLCNNPRQVSYHRNPPAACNRQSCTTIIELSPIVTDQSAVSQSVNRGSTALNSLIQIHRTRLILWRDVAGKITSTVWIASYYCSILEAAFWRQALQTARNATSNSFREQHCYCFGLDFLKRDPLAALSNRSRGWRDSDKK